MYRYMGYVYLLMSTDTNGNTEIFKIGITTSSITKRIKALSTGNPNQIRLISSYESTNFKLIEKWLHSKYSAFKSEARNEWFLLSEKEVSSFIATCKELESKIIFLSKNNTFLKDL